MNDGKAEQDKAVGVMVLGLMVDVWQGGDSGGGWRSQENLEHRECGGYVSSVSGIHGSSIRSPGNSCIERDWEKRRYGRVENEEELGSIA